MAAIIPRLTPDNREHLHRMVVLQPGEEVVCKINHHPFGIIIQYAVGIIGVIVAAIFVVLLSARFSAQSNGGGSSTAFVLYVVFGILAIGLVALMAAASKVYWNSHWILTTDSLTQVNQSSLFGVQVSELSLENLEDVTVMQTGIFAHMFHYGTLRAETAGERSKFVFGYCPTPHEYARLIIDAREKFVQSPAIARQRQSEDPKTSDQTS